jgi:hypothetical protein
MLLYKDDVQFGVFTPFRVTLFSKISAMSSVSEG